MLLSSVTTAPQSSLWKDQLRSNELKNNRKMLGVSDLHRLISL